MLRKYLLGIAAFALAFAILSISVLQSASVSYVFATQIPDGSKDSQVKSQEINYQIAYPGSVLPDNPLWYLKVGRDKLWFLFTANRAKKAELALLFADKRLASSLALFEKKKPDIALSTLSKSEKYLETAVKLEEAARMKGDDTGGLLTKLANAALKHRQVIEEKILPLTPEDGRPEAIKTEDYAKSAFATARDALLGKSLPVPISPFDGQ